MKSQILSDCFVVVSNTTQTATLKIFPFLIYKMEVVMCCVYAVLRLIGVSLPGVGLIKSFVFFSIVYFFFILTPNNVSLFFF